MKQLAEVVTNLANTSDSLGRPLFAGRSPVEMPSKDINGNITYHGDRGQHTVQISESKRSYRY